MRRPVKKGLKYYAESAANLVYGTAFTTLMLMALVLLSPTVFIIMVIKRLRKLVIKVFKKRVEMETGNC